MVCGNLWTLTISAIRILETNTINTGHCAQSFLSSASRLPKLELGCCSSYKNPLNHSGASTNTASDAFASLASTSYLTLGRRILELVLIPIVGQWLAASKTFLETLTICRTPISALGDAMEARTPIDGVKGRFPILLEDGTIFAGDLDETWTHDL